jgi:hypothetical protein
MPQTRFKPKSDTLTETPRRKSDSLNLACLVACLGKRLAQSYKTYRSYRSYGCCLWLLPTPSTCALSSPDSPFFSGPYGNWGDLA